MTNAAFEAHAVTASRRRVRRARVLALTAAGAVVALGLSACGGGKGATAVSTKTSGVTITVALATTPPPKATLEAFTKQTGITVKWSNIDWDSLQTKITAAATAKTYFADATDVDWSRVGQLHKLNAFYPMGKYLDTKSLAADMPQLSSFTSGGDVVGIPYDASFDVTTVNKTLFAKAGITTLPTTMDQYTQDLKQIKSKGVVQYPLNIPFAAAEGLSTYWYQATAAFGGTVLDDKYKPTFSDSSSAGYKAMQWMVDAMKNGLVPPGNINVTDSQGIQNLMAKGVVASTFGDYSGQIGSLYNVPASSKVVNQVVYLKTPGTDGPAPNNNNPDGIGIPKQAKYPNAAATFIKWFTSADNQKDFAGLSGSAKTFVGYTMPSHLSAVTALADKGTLAGGDVLADMLKNSAQSIFKGGAPAWYPQFSRSVYTNLHAAAAGSMTVDAAIKAIAATATSLATSSS